MTAAVDHTEDTEIVDAEVVTDPEVTDAPKLAAVAELRRPAGALALLDSAQSWTPQQTAALSQLGLDRATVADLDVFLHTCQKTGLDPFAKQIYMIGRYDKDAPNQTKWTIQTGIDGFRVIANRSPAYEGQTAAQWCGPDGIWTDVWLQPKPPAAARVGIYRKGFVEPIYAVAVFTEYAQTKRDGTYTAMWSSKPSIMIAKCAEALAFRKAFPQDLSGIYTAEEMAQADMDRPARVESNGRDVVDHQDTRVSRADAEKAANEARWLEAFEKAVDDLDLSALHGLGTTAGKWGRQDLAKLAKDAWPAVVAATKERDEAAVAAAQEPVTVDAAPDPQLPLDDDLEQQANDDAREAEMAAADPS